MTEYVPPEWGKEGKNLFDISIDVIKGGVVVETVKLPLDEKKSCIVAGRMEPLCDLVLEHPSISRTHAALQFDAKGALFLMDFKSTHGTFVNKKRIDPHDFKRLNIGDIISFGESSRLYAICGPQELLPAEYQSLNLQKFRERLQKKKKEARWAKGGSKEEGEGEGEGEGISWGFGEDAEEESSEDEEKPEDKGESSTSNKRNVPSYLRNLKDEETPYTSSISKQDYNEKDSKLIQQLETRIKKMENLKEEKKRILVKQNTTLAGLTEGQEKQIERNEQRIQALMDEIKSIELKIQAKNQQRQVTKTQQQHIQKQQQKQRGENEDIEAYDYDYASDEDDFYDRTKAHKSRTTLSMSSHPTSPSLRRKNASISESNMSSTVTSPRGGAGVGAGAKGADGAGAKGAGGVLTASSIQKTISQLESELKRLENKEQQIQMAIDEKQVSGAAVKEEMDSLDSYMQSTTQELQEDLLTCTQTKRKQLEKELETQRQLLQVAMPALPSMMTSQSLSQQEKKSKNDFAVSPKKPLAPSETTGSKTCPILPVQMPVVSVEDENSKKRVMGADVCPPFSANKNSFTSFSEPEPKKKKKTVAVKKSPTSRPSSDANTLQGGEKVWVPPVGQTGDGRTKLNDKYGY